MAALTAAINPLKLKEYMATGLPVLSTPIPEACRLGEFIIVRREGDEWVSALGEVLHPSITKLKPPDFLESESWPKKAELMIQICYGTGS